MAPGQGFEPRQTDPESVVLPLHKPGELGRNFRQSLFYHVSIVLATLNFFINSYLRKKN